MALKGTTKIELTNVKTGAVEVYEKHNLVTSAVPSLLENPFAWQLKSEYNQHYFAGNVLPLCRNLFGGILLYESTIPEDVNQIYAQSDNALVGYANIEVNGTDDTMRGSLNQTESGYLETNDGYRYVYDFSTSQANGTISAVGLTSKFGGIAGYGSMQQRNTQSPAVYYSYLNINDASIFYAYISILHYDENTGIATSMYVSDQNMITVTRFKLNTKEWTITGNMGVVGPVIETQRIETKVFSGATPVKSPRRYNLCDGGDGYIWGFEHAGGKKGNAEGNATINWIKIKVDDLTIEEGTWDINGQIYNMGAHQIRFSEAIGYSSLASCVVLDGYLYCIKYDRTGLYKIDLGNPTNIKFIEYPNGKIMVNELKDGYQGYSVYYAAANLVVAGNKVCMINGWLNGNKIVPNSSASGYVGSKGPYLSDGWVDDSNSDKAYPFRNSCGMYGIRVGTFLLFFTGYYRNDSPSSPVYGQILLDSPYLATINNLPAPVEKTADKTMKITYILREEQTTEGGPT